MQKYQCNVCEYVYDPKLGDSSSKIESETPFEDLPEEWGCPTCGAKQTQFHRDEPACIT